MASGEKYAEAPVSCSGEDRYAYVVDDYTARITPDFLKYKEEELPSIVDAEDFEAEDTDPRSEGNLVAP